MFVSTVTDILHYVSKNTYETVVHSDPSLTFEMELFAKIVYDIKQRS